MIAPPDLLRTPPARCVVKSWLSRFWPPILCLSLGCWLTSCQVLSRKNNEPASKRFPPTEHGVRTAADGDAVAEVDARQDRAFDVVERFLRDKLKVVFMNRRVGKLDATGRGKVFHVRLVELTTGKTGLSVTALNRDDKRPDREAARNLADEIVSALESDSKQQSVPTKRP